MLAARSQASETPTEACAGAYDRELRRLTREQGSSKHVPRMALDVEVACAWKQSSDVAGSMSCIHVPAVKARATSASLVSNACVWDACHAAAAGYHLETRSGRGWVRRARPSEAPATVFSAVKDEKDSNPRACNQEVL